MVTMKRTFIEASPDAERKKRQRSPYSYGALNRQMPFYLLNGHNWSEETGKESWLFICEQPENSSIEAVVQTIHGLSRWEIRAIRIGLSRNELAGHNWEDKSGELTIRILSRQNDTPLGTRMEQIRGLPWNALSALSQGISLEHVKAHNWHDSVNEHDTIGATLRYLALCPYSVPKQTAMNNILGLSGPEIQSIIKCHNYGRQKLDLTYDEMFRMRLDTAMCETILQRYQQPLPDDASPPTPENQVRNATLTSNAVQNQEPRKAGHKR